MLAVFEDNVDDEIVQVIPGGEYDAPFGALQDANISFDSENRTI